MASDMHASLRDNKKLVIVFGIGMCAMILSGIIILVHVNSIGDVAFAQVPSSLKSTTTINPVGNTSNNNKISTINAEINKLNFTSATGTIASLQNDASGKPAWIVSGQWQMLVFKPRLEESQSKPATVIFNTIFDMVRPDGAALHTHTISSTFNLTGISNSVNNNNHLSSTTINGTTRLVTIGLPNMIGIPNINVPVSIKIIDRSAFSLWIDPSKIGNHFGNTPIYGIVTTKSG
jgi:hypothetical protein